jgi:hypothetical protein
MVRVPDKPLPGDLVIRCRQDHVLPFNRVVNVWVITHWPDTENIVAGPYQSYNYALEQSQRLLRDRSDFIWRDHARAGAPEQLELVGSGVTLDATAPPNIAASRSRSDRR